MSAIAVTSDLIASLRRMAEKAISAKAAADEESRTNGYGYCMCEGSPCVHALANKAAQDLGSALNERTVLSLLDAFSEAQKELKLARVVVDKAADLIYRDTAHEALRAAVASYDNGGQPPRVLHPAYEAILSRARSAVDAAEVIGA